MKSTYILSLVACSLAAVACASFPTPTERLAQAESGARAAQEVGAANEPAAALHLKMANDQIAEAKKLMADGDNERADAVLSRAQSDAELSLQLTKEAQAKVQAQDAMNKIAGMQSQAKTGAK